MILKLQGADFSANNIGTLDLRTAPDTQTANLLALYGKTWTLDKQLAINDFLLGLQSASYYSKISKLLMPILAPTATISLTTTATNNIAFYDIKNAAYVQTKANNVNTYHKIGVNGLYADNAANGNSYGLCLNNLCTGVDKNNLHIGLYYNAANLTDLVGGNLYHIVIQQDKVSLGYSAGIATGTYDVNTKLNKGLKIVSFTPTLVTGLSNSLPLSATAANASNNADFAAQQHFNLLSKNNASDNIKLGTNIGLLTLGTALTQPETVSYNQLIDTLMNKLWV
jgi:hypothetical protein